MYLRLPVHGDQRLEGVEVWKSKLEEERLEEEVETSTDITAKRSICGKKIDKQTNQPFYIKTILNNSGYA